MSPPVDRVVGLSAKAKCPIVLSDKCVISVPKLKASELATAKASVLKC